MATTETTAAAKRPTGRRHNTATMSRARTMYGDGDMWTPTQIAGYLTARGNPVSVQTVREWVIPGLAETRRAQQNAKKAARRAARAAPEPTPRLDRMRELRAAGLSMAGIAIVLRVDEGIHLSGDNVRYALKVGREP